MKNNKVDVKKLRLAQIRYFDSSRNGCEIPQSKAYAFLINVDGQYVNILNPAMEYPVYDRSPYSNTTLDGEDFGNRLILVNGEVKNGTCYVMELIDVGELFNDSMVNISTIEKFVFQSDYFFPDRIDLYQNKSKISKDKYVYYKKYQHDLILMKRLQKYLNMEANKTFQK